MAPSFIFTKNGLVSVLVMRPTTIPGAGADAEQANTHSKTRSAEFISYSAVIETHDDRSRLQVCMAWRERASRASHANGASRLSGERESVPGSPGGVGGSRRGKPLRLRQDQARLTSLLLHVTHGSMGQRAAARDPGRIR